LPRSLCEAALERGIDVFAGYGMSETCPILTLAQVKASALSDPEREIDRRRCAGLPIPLVDLRTVDENLHDIPHDGKASGEVVARAPWLTQGYYRNPQAGEALWAGGYLHTNDIGVIDADGYLQITDRLKDVIKTGGEWVSSLTLEDLLSRHPAVSEAAVIGVPDLKWGERPMALIVLRAGHEKKVDAADIQRHMKTFADAGQIPKYAVAERVLFIPEIAKTSVGKLNKKLLREQYASAAL
jgi:fatty-acyl-CoA synthase